MSSIFESAEYVAPEQIFDVTDKYLADTHPNKVILAQGTYRDGDGKPWIMPSVRMAKEAIADCGHEYLPMSGLKFFREKAVELVFDGTKAFHDHKIASCQSLSGTGALLLAGMAIKKGNPDVGNVLITDPTWSNHELLFQTIGFQVKKLPYYKEGAFDFEGYLTALKAADFGSVIVLHSCAHNPTGCDPSRDQWKEIAAVIKEKGMFPILDSAYLGFNSGSIDEDAWVIRYIVDELGIEASVCMSFAKSMGLYGERIGLVTFITGSVATTRIVNSILETCQRATVATPPLYGAMVAGTVLNTPEIAKQWAVDLVTMSKRIKAMRQRLYSELSRLDTPAPGPEKDWSHLLRQTGMFGYTGITSKQIEHLQEEWHIYMADTSRISIAGLNEGNVEYFAKAIDQTVRSID